MGHNGIRYQEFVRILLNCYQWCKRKYRKGMAINTCIPISYGGYLYRYIITKYKKKEKQVKFIYIYISIFIIHVYIHRHCKTNLPKRYNR